MNYRDEQMFELLAQESKREKETINLIASENYPSPQILEIVGSPLSSKYAEGYPGKRYYAGCALYDAMEQLTIERMKKLFGAQGANVQPHSGSCANLAVYQALLQPKDCILSMSLSSGGHLSHGHTVHLTGKLYTIVSYGVDSITYQIDYDQVERLALQYQPKLIIAGASAYPFIIDFARMHAIAKRVGAYFLADIAHVAGLVAAGVYPSPVAYADVVTFTTQKTFRGPRGGVILYKKEHETAIAKAVMPGLQGGPLMNNVIAKGVAAYEAMQPDFALYVQQVVLHARAMASWFEDHGVRVVGGGTHTHLFLLDVTAYGLDGKQAEQILESVGIVVNKNMLPFDTGSAIKPSGIRIGTAAMTTRGFTLEDFIQVAQLIDSTFKNHENENELALIAKQVRQLCQNR